MEQAAQKLCNIFQDVHFAWQLLNAQIQIEMATVAPGQTIAYLLQLYMRGVQKMNSLADPRQSYFKNKVTSLMTKQTVIKSLKQNPMKKKSKPDQVTLKQDKQGKSSAKKKKKEQQNQINQLQLKQKRKQLQMRMAYVAEQHGPQSLKKIIAEQNNRQQNISSKISKIMNSHEQRLNERIKARKLKTSTFRSHSQVNHLQQNENQQNGFDRMQKIQQQKNTPFNQLVLQNITKHQPKKQQNSSKHNYRRYKSLQIDRDLGTPDKKSRKYTYDQVNPRQSIG